MGAGCPAEEENNVAERDHAREIDLILQKGSELLQPAIHHYSSSLAHTTFDIDQSLALV